MPAIAERSCSYQKKIYRRKNRGLKLGLYHQQQFFKVYAKINKMTENIHSIHAPNAYVIVTHLMLMTLEGRCYLPHVTEEEMKEAPEDFAQS